jgi:CDGSH-type Zn-finger protein
MSDSVDSIVNPIVFDVEKGRDYFWCACGLSKTQPFCDGSHKGSGFSPKKYTAARNERVWFCLCKKTKHAPLCDGTHNKLEKKA